MAKLTVNLDNAVIGDLRLFEKFQNNTHSVDELLGFLNRVVESDTDVESLPLSEMRTIMTQVSEAATNLGDDDPKD